MKTITKLGTLTTILLIAIQVNAQSKDQTVAENTVHEYFKALNASDAAKVVSLFAEDGVLLPTGAPTASGAEQLKGNYDYVFDNFSFDLNETIGSVIVEGNYAFIRSTSQGKLVIKAEGQEVTDDFRELFVLKKVDGDWKIDTYMYNQSK